MSEHEPEEPPIRFTDNRKIFRDAFGAKASAPSEGAGPDGATPDGVAPDGVAPDGVAPAGPVPDASSGADAAPETGAAVDENAQLLEERTRDLQRLSAEYANYRKRADRERLAAGEIAVGRALVELLPVVDDLDRARAHDDLSGPLKAVADKLDAAFGKLGLVAFGDVGDPFDPALHEAVMHDESDAVTVPTATTVMRRGFRHGERLLRPAMVGVTDPTNPSNEAPADATAANATDASTAPDATTSGLPEGDHPTPPDQS